MTRPNTHTDNLYATRLLQDYERSFPRPIQWDVAVIWWTIIALLALFWSWALTPLFLDDFTDTGVGCIECLDPAPVIQPSQWEA